MKHRGQSWPPGAIYIKKNARDFGRGTLSHFAAARVQVVVELVCGWRAPGETTLAQQQPSLSRRQRRRMRAEEQPLVASDDEEDSSLLHLQPTKLEARAADGHHRRRVSPRWTRTVGHLALGQLLSVLVCTTGVFSKRLAQAGIVAPTAQSFANYAMLGLVWSAVLAVHPPAAAPSATVDAPREQHWRPRACHALIAAADVEANYIVVKAYSLTSFTSVQLMGCASLPLAMLLSKRYLGRRYSAPHYLALAGCVGGLALLVLSDTSTDSSAAAPAPLLGDLLCLASGSLYALSNVGQEAVLTPAEHARGRLAAAVQARPPSGGSSGGGGGGWSRGASGRLEGRAWLARLGIFGSGISAVQILLLEREELLALGEALQAGEQDGGWVATQAVGFGLALFSFYSLAPLLFAARGAVFFNLSLLTANFWCEKRHFLRHSYIKTNISPRHARDKHRKNSKKSGVLCRAVIVGRFVFDESPLTAAAGAAGGAEGGGESGRGQYLTGFVMIMVAVTVFNLTPETPAPPAPPGGVVRELEGEGEEEEAEAEVRERLTGKRGEGAKSAAAAPVSTDVHDE
jgi:drug/metabolite transporter (DMT)-like permease